MEKLTENEVLSLLNERLPAEVQLTYKTERKIVETKNDVIETVKNVQLYLMVSINEATYSVFVNDGNGEKQFTGLDLHTALEKYNEA